MSIEFTDINFEVPSFLIHHYYVTGTMSILMNLFVFYLILFHNKNMDSFRYYMLSFQLACSLVDIHLSFLMQPIPLFPLRGGHCSGVFVILFNSSPHDLMIVLSTLVGTQVNTLNVCFLRKHQAIAKIDKKHILPTPIYNFLVVFFLSYTFIYTTCFYLSELTKEEQFRMIDRDYAIFRSEFYKLANFNIYEMNPPFMVFFLLIIAGCLQSICTVSLLVFQMYTTLMNCRHNLSKTTLEKHKTALKSLVAQFLTTPIGILPAMLIVSTVFFPFHGAQLFTWYMLMTMSTHSTINSLVVIFTIPEFRDYVLFCTNKRKRNTSTVIFDISGVTRTSRVL